LAGRLFDPLRFKRGQAYDRRLEPSTFASSKAPFRAWSFVRRVVWSLHALALFAVAQPAHAKYDVDIDAPRSVRSLLKDHLDLSRFKKRDDISDDQFDFLVTATPQEVRDLVATDGYFTPVVRTDVKHDGDKKSVTISVDPGPQTKVASVSLTFKGAITTEDPAQENTARFAFSVREGDPFSQSAWDDAKKAALKALQSRRYLGAKISQSKARVNPRTHIADLSVTFDSGPTFTFGKLDISGVRRYPEQIIHNVDRIHPGAAHLFGELDDQDCVLDGDADEHQRSDKRRQAKRSVADEERADNADRRERHRHHNRERIDERLELRREQHINEQNRKDDDQRHRAEGIGILLDRRPEIPTIAGRQRIGGHDLSGFANDFAERHTEHGRVDVDAALFVLAADLRRTDAVDDLRQRT